MRRMTPTEMLEFIGEALYGPRWQRPLATAIGINERQIRRWMKSGNLDKENEVFKRALGLLQRQETALFESRHGLVRWLWGV